MKNKNESVRGDDRIVRAYAGEDENGAVRLATLDKEQHTAEFVIATEAPVADRFYGPPTALSMKGAALKDYRANPVVLAQHEQGLLAVVGRSLKVWTETVQGRNVLVARMQFDAADEFSARVWGKVERGFLRAASIGYRVTERREVEQGKMDKALGLEGPVSIATQWRLLEWSIVAVGADAQSLGRSAETPDASAEAEERAADDVAFQLPTLPPVNFGDVFLGR